MTLNFWRGVYKSLKPVVQVYFLSYRSVLFSVFECLAIYCFNGLPGTFAASTDGRSRTTLGFAPRAPALAFAVAAAGVAGEAAAAPPPRPPPPCAPRATYSHQSTRS